MQKTDAGATREILRFVTKALSGPEHVNQAPMMVATHPAIPLQNVIRITGGRG
jgi:hypothetical protein